MSSVRRIPLLFITSALIWLGCEGWSTLPSSAGGGGENTLGGNPGMPAVGGAADGGRGGAGNEGGTPGGGNGGSGATTPTPNCEPPTGTVPKLALELVADGLEEPVALEVAPGDTERLFILEKPGRIRVIENGVLLETPFLDLTDVTWSPSEAGLLALAFHPDYAVNGRFFVYYTQQISNTGAHLQEFRVSSDPNVAERAPVGAPYIEVLQAHIHDGGSAEFSPIDGYLYLSLGERGTEAWAQDLDQLVGKILRIDVSTNPHTIPPGNLDRGRPEIWDYGLRNPWRMSFDPCTGVLYIGDVGQWAREEINIEEPGVGHHNYGWPMMEGRLCRLSPCDPFITTWPALDLTHGPPDNMNVVLGGVVYRGDAIPALRGMYMYGDTFAGLRGLRYEGGTITELADFSNDIAAQINIPVSIGQDHDGEVYMLDLTGSVLRVVPASD